MAAEAGAATGAAAALGAPWATARTSRSTMRPPGPEPATVRKIDAQLDGQRFGQRRSQESAARSRCRRRCRRRCRCRRDRRRRARRWSRWRRCCCGRWCRRTGLTAPGENFFGLRDQVGDVLPFVAQDGHRRSELDRIAFGDQELEQDALVLEVEVHVGLVGLDFGHQVAGLDRIALTLDPLDEHALLHGRRQFGKSDDLSHFRPFGKQQGRHLQRARETSSRPIDSMIRCPPEPAGTW